MAYDWTSKTSCLSNMKANYENARVWGSSAATELNNANAHIDLVADPEAKAALEHLRSAGNLINFQTGAMRVWGPTFNPTYAVIYFLQHHTISETAEPEEYVLTWEKITQAWSKADTFGRQATILAIDFMRKDLWNKPISLTDLAGYDWIS